MSPEGWILVVALALALMALVWVIGRLLVHQSDQNNKLVSMTAPYPHQAYIEIRRMELEVMRGQPHPPQPYGQEREEAV